MLAAGQSATVVSPRASDMGGGYACSVTYAFGCGSAEQRKPIPLVQSKGAVPSRPDTGVGVDAGESGREHGDGDVACKNLFSHPLNVMPMPSPSSKNNARAPLQLTPDGLPRPPEPQRSPVASQRREPPSRFMADNEERPGLPRPVEAQVLSQAGSDVAVPSPSAHLGSMERETAPLLSKEKDTAVCAEASATGRDIASAPGAVASTHVDVPPPMREDSWLESLASGCTAMSISHPASSNHFGDTCAMPNDACSMPDLQEPDKVILQEDESWSRCRRAQLASEYRTLPDVGRANVETAVGASLVGPHLRPRTLFPEHERTW